MDVNSCESQFIMHGARAAIAGGMLQIEEQVKSLEKAVDENSGLAFDLAKTIIESVCKTIIIDRGRTFTKEDTVSDLYRAVTGTVPFLPSSMAGNTEARRKLLKTLGGLNAALQGVCELRNAFGFASHGSDKPRTIMEAAQALLAAQAADAIIGFLYRVHHQDVHRPRAVLMTYNDNTGFNEWLDEECEPFQIFSLPLYLPSEVLFSIDKDAYRDLLIDYEAKREFEDMTDSADQGNGIA